MIARRHRRRRQIEGAELELTAFINPMVVLVTFLLINVVFSHSAILDLRLPGPANGASAAPAGMLQLEVTVRAKSIVVADRDRGPLQTIPNTAAGPDLDALSAELQQLKGQYPDQTDASLLVEPDIAYDRIVQVMDTVRAFQTQVGNQHLSTELFPDIAIGDAPVKDK